MSFYRIVVSIRLKNGQFLNVSGNYNLKALLLFYPKSNFQKCQILRRNKWKTGLKLEKFLMLQVFGGDFSSLSLKHCYYTPIYTFPPKLGKKLKKNLQFWTNCQLFPNFAVLPPYLCAKSCI